MSLAQQVKDFLGVPFNRYLVVALLAVGAIAYTYTPAEPTADKESFIHFFYLPTCPHCSEQHSFNEYLENRYGIDIGKHDVSTPEEARHFTKVCSDYNLRGLVPTTIVGDHVFVGYDEEIGHKIEEAVKNCLEGECETQIEHTCTEKETYVVALPLLGETDLRAYSLPALAVMLGLIDGFNPCAMWVLVYLIALVMEVQSRRRIWFIVGTFVLASGILYFLFMTAWLNAFLLIGYLKIVTMLIGLVALGGGILHLKEYIEKKGAVECKVGDAEGRRNTMSRMDELVHSPMTIPTVVGIIALAFVVNSIEFACSAALPAIFTQILALSNLSAIQYYGYILLYDIFFMLDDFIIFSLAVISINAMATNERYIKISRVLGGVLMIGIGAILLFAPHILR